MGPPEDVEFDDVEEGRVENGLLMNGEVGEVGDAVVCEDEGGRVSQERVRRHDCRIMLKDVGVSGS